MTDAKKLNSQWCFWFCLGNILLLYLIGLKYFDSLPWLSSPILHHQFKIVVYIFTELAFIGQLSLFVFFIFLIGKVLTYFLSRKILFPVMIFISSTASILLLLDTYAFTYLHLHINKLIISLIISSFFQDVFNLSILEKLMAFVAVITLTAIEILIAWVSWRITKKNKWHTVKYWISALLGLSLYFSYCIMFYFVDPQYSRIFWDTGYGIPFYTNILSLFSTKKDSQALMARLGELYTNHGANDKNQLKYPLEQLKFDPQNSKYNLLVIVIDTWRFDMLNKEIMPNVYHFSQNAWTFTNHFSGGNATGPGIFSLFYSLPATYWAAMENQHQSPILINTLLQKNYLMKIFSSGTLQAPAIVETVFASLDPKPKQVSGDKANIRDLEVTKDFKEFIQTYHNEKPFFAFLFYDSAHSYCSIDLPPYPYQPIQQCDRYALDKNSNYEPYLNRYKNSLVFLDQQLKEVLSILKNKNFFKNTVILITGDHGEEFNDNHLGYFGHSSAYTEAQVKTPLILYWPGEKPQVFHHRTSHYDVAPTLMTKLFSCKIPITSYSFGTNLLDKKIRSYLVVKSYLDLGIVEPQQVIRIYSTGRYEVDKLNGQPTKESTINYATLEKAFKDITKFYQ